MSNSEVSERVQEQAENGSAFDFLYADHARIGTFLSQFNEFGDLTGIIHGKAAQRGKSDTEAVKVQSNAVVVKGGSDYAQTTKAEYSESSQRSYDPRWTNALGFLDRIEERGLLKREIEEARFGDLVLVTGALQIKHLSTLAKFWQMPSIKIFGMAAAADIAENHSEHDRTEGDEPDQTSEQPIDVDLFFDILKVLPHTTQLEIGTSPSAWGILKEDGLLTAGSDFMLKFGQYIPGEWAVIGILDARPDTSGQSEDPLLDIPNVERLLEGFKPGLEVVKRILPNLSDFETGIEFLRRRIEFTARQVFGRPHAAYGITPLVVFREVGSR